MQAELQQQSQVSVQLEAELVNDKVEGLAIHGDVGDHWGGWDELVDHPHVEHLVAARAVRPLRGPRLPAGQRALGDADYQAAGSHRETELTAAKGCRLATGPL